MAGNRSNSGPQSLVFIIPDKDRSMAGNQSNFRPQILVFILPDKDSIIYGRIKGKVNRTGSSTVASSSRLVNAIDIRVLESINFLRPPAP